MPDRPADVHISDLSNPRFAAHIAEIMSDVAPVAEAIDLRPIALLQQAQAETGLVDYGDDRFREPLEVFLTAVGSEAHLSPMGKVSVFSQVLQLLKNRLLIQDTLNRHPEIHQIEIDRPIVIAGLPRTGTTHLHNLMSADVALRSLPYWESLEPLLSEDERRSVGRGEPDPRLGRCDATLSVLNEAAPYLKRMHEMTTWHVHEEIQLLAIDFSTMLFETLAVVPSYAAWYRAADQTPTYRYLKTVLKVLQWSRGGKRWVLKSPQHLEQFGPLMQVFPDATVVITHRDPTAVTASLATMLAYLARLSTAPVDPVAIGAYWAPRVEQMLSACLRDRDLLPADQSMDVLFDDFMADDIAMVKRIYGIAGQPFTASVESRMAQFMIDHPRGRHGRVHYDLNDVGIDEAALRLALHPYSLRFGVNEEVLNRR